MPSYSPSRVRAISGLLSIAAFILVSSCRLVPFRSDTTYALQTAVETVTETDRLIAEPYGVAVKGGEVFVSDGSSGKIVRISNGAISDFLIGLNTPSAIAFAPNGDLVIADTGSHTIKKVDGNGAVSVIAGVEGGFGDKDGPAAEALFNAPIGVAVADDGAIIVADTYNDKVKLIRDGNVSTIAGSSRGFAEGTGRNAKFDTPCAVVAWSDGRILVADTMNSRLRMITSAGVVSTLAGTGEPAIEDGSLLGAKFYRPTAVAVGPEGSLYVGDDNSVRAIRNRALPVVETISGERRGFIDGPLGVARFNRLSGIAVGDDNQIYVADSDNGAVRRLFSAIAEKVGKPGINDRSKRTDPAEFRQRQPPRWPYDPPEAKRDIAGTLGEIRDVYVDGNSHPRFHNGLDIAGAYGETARFIWDETVLDPLSAENFDSLRELIRLPSIGYIHIRLGRDASNRPLGGDRFQFDPEMKGVRVRRGTRFRAGEPVGTLNSMNHIHMVAGPSGDEMNALEALVLPGVSDTIPPTIEDVGLYDQNWKRIETERPEVRNNLPSNLRIVVRAFDRMDGNPERRRLGVFRLGYRVAPGDHSSGDEVDWTISFNRNPSPDAVKFAYAPGSKSGPTGETIFRYVVTNRVDGSSFSEGFFDPNRYAAGKWVLRVFVADYFGNTTTKDINFEVAK